MDTPNCLILLVTGELQSGKVLELYKFPGDYLLVGGDGSQYFESEKIHRR